MRGPLVVAAAATALYGAAYATASIDRLPGGRLFLRVSDAVLLVLDRVGLVRVMEPPTAQELGADESLAAALAAQARFFWSSLRPSARLARRRLFAQHVRERAALLQLPPVPPRAALERPVFLLGAARVGSTAFHGILGAQEFTSVLTQAQLMAPLDADRARRARHNAWARWVNPAMPGVHAVRADDPDECHLGFRELLTPELHRMLDGEAQAEWRRWYCEEAPVARQMALYRRAVERLLPPDSGFFVDKSPLTVYAVREYARAFPGVRFVWLHRRPAELVASFMGLTQMWHVLDFGAPTPEPELRATTRALWASGLRLAMQAREELEREGVQFVDVYFDDVMRDPSAAVRALLRALGEPEPAAGVVERATEAFLRAQRFKPAAHRREFKYEVEDGDDEAFREYMERFF